jgi:hypothetical protein
MKKEFGVDHARRIAINAKLEDALEVVKRRGEAPVIIDGRRTSFGDEIYARHYRNAKTEVVARIRRICFGRLKGEQKPTDTTVVRYLNNLSDAAIAKKIPGATEQLVAEVREAGFGKLEPEKR